MKPISLLLIPGRRLAISALLLFASITAWSQSIFDNPITATNPSASNPYTTGQTVDPNTTVSGIGRGSGITANAGSNRYNATGFTTSTTIDLTDYFEFTLTPNTGFNIDFTSFVYTGQRSTQGPTSFAFRSSVSSFATDIGTPSATGATISLSASTFQNVTTAITFRLYGFDAGAASGTFSVDDFTFNGSVNTSLPINLISFTGQKSASGTKLSWATSCNSTARSFAVEQSSGTKSFTDIGTVDARPDNCNGSLRYTFDAPALNAARTLYRLAMTDASGEKTYSSTIALSHGKTSSDNALRISPNPAKDLILIDGIDAGAAWYISDIEGRILKSGTFSESLSPINIGNLAANLYILHCAGRQPVKFVRE